MERDPVCGMMVEPATAAADVVHKGKTYYFCGKSCARKFSTDPEHYLKSMPAAAGQVTPVVHHGGAPVATDPPSPLPIVGGSPLTKDPVCGMSVDPARAAAMREHEGKKYLFCSTGCGERFEKEPGRFLAAPGTAGMEHATEARASQKSGEGSAASKKIRYTCPMHPEVTQWGPGTCPKCGMALEPMDIVAAGPDDEPDPEYVSMRKRFWVSAALTLPVFLLGMFGEYVALPISGAARNWIELALASPVVLWGGWPFF